ncbi:copper resistance CopC family protein [Pseudoclavibacter helvolus]|uniref:copper resistance CopC family protein n=1 Tax=Pseudoclavibacter helvolus TaxID=255205 RepID=UPI003C760A92
MSFDSASLPTTTTRLLSSTAPRRVFGLAAAVAALILACLLGFAGAAPAQAHDQLIQSSPTPDQALDEAPTQIALTYSANIMEIGPMIVLQDAAGTTWPTGEPLIDGPNVTSTVDDALPDGTYAINWRVVSSDGHPITGTIPFTVGDPAAADAPAAASTPAPEPTPSATTVSPTETESPSGATTEPTAEAASRSPLDVPRMLLIGGLGALVALGIAWVIVRSRKGAAPAAGQGDVGQPDALPRDPAPQDDDAR